jgi:hypothetical protein
LSAKQTSFLVALRIIDLIVNFDNDADWTSEYQQQVREDFDKVKPLGVQG